MLSHRKEVEVLKKKQTSAKINPIAIILTHEFKWFTETWRHRHSSKKANKTTVFHNYIGTITCSDPNIIFLNFKMFGKDNIVCFEELISTIRGGMKIVNPNCNRRKIAFLLY